MDKQYEIIIGADVLPTPSNYNNFINGNFSGVVDDNLIQTLRCADFRMYNLEGPLITYKTPILKDGPVLDAPAETSVGFKTLGTDLFVLANNHIYDHGEIGIKSTIERLEVEDIPWIGLGTNREQRAQAYYINNEDYIIGIYNCCENEFSTIKKNNLRTNAYDPLETFDDIQNIKAKCDYLIVAYHGGKEKLHYPSPNLMRIFHKFADKGADVVVAQHTHCIGAYEEYNGSLLIYGQGNFIFDIDNGKNNDESILLKLLFTENGIQYEFLPICKDGSYIRMATDTEKSIILGKIDEWSSRLSDYDFIENEYSKNADIMIGAYLSAFRGRTLISRIFGRIFGNRFRKVRRNFLKNSVYNAYDLACIYNNIRCEAHREVLEKGLIALMENKK